MWIYIVIKAILKKNEEWNKLQNLGNPHNGTLHIFYLWLLSTGRRSWAYPCVPSKQYLCVYTLKWQRNIPRGANPVTQPLGNWLGCTLQLWLQPQHCKDLQKKGSSFLSECSGLLNRIITAKQKLKQWLALLSWATCLIFCYWHYQSPGRAWSRGGWISHILGKSKRKQNVT